MATLDSVPGAGVLVDEDHTIIDGNVRAEIVFREDVDVLQETDLETLSEWGLFEDADLAEWQAHVDSVLSGDQNSATGQVTLTPNGGDDTYVYELRVRPLGELPAGAADRVGGGEEGRQRLEKYTASVGAGIVPLEAVRPVDRGGTKPGHHHRQEDDRPQNQCVAPLATRHVDEEGACWEIPRARE